MTLICKGERRIDIQLHPKLWMYNAKGIHQFRIHKMPIQFCDKHVKNYKTLGLHLCNGCQENILAHWWINSNNTLKM